MVVRVVGVAGVSMGVRGGVRVSMWVGIMVGVGAEVVVGAGCGRGAGGGLWGGRHVAGAVGELTHITAGVACTGPAAAR